MANLAAHAVASHAAAKQGAAGASASAHAAASGPEALFAALLMQASQSANDAGPATDSKTKSLAELLNGSAALPAAAAKDATHRNPAQKIGADADALLAAMATHPVAQPPTPSNVAAITAHRAHTEKTQAHPAAAGTLAQPKHKSEAVSEVAAPVLPDVAVAAPAVFTPSHAGVHTAPSDGHDTRAPAAAVKTASAEPAAKATGVLADLIAARTAAHQAQLHADAPAVAKVDAAAQEPANANPRAAAATAGTHSQGLETALAALQLNAQKHVGANANSREARQPDAKAATPAAQHRAAFAAATQNAAHQDMPLPRTTSALATSAQAAATPHAAQTRSDTSTSGGQGGNTQSHNGHGAPAQAKTAEPAAPPAQIPTAQAVHTGAAAADPSAAVQSAAVTPTAPAHVAASLHVAAQSAAHGADQQAVPLSDLGAIAINIAAQSKDGAKQFNIALHPRDMGHIHVRLSVDHSGAAQAHLSADNPQTLTLLQRDSHLLERALKDAGLNLTGNGLNFSLKGQDRQNGNSAQTNGRGRKLSVTAVASTNAPAAAAASTYNLAPNHVRLDIRV